MIKKGHLFNWNGEEWAVIEICLDRHGKPIDYYLCQPSNPWSEYEGKPCYWTESEITRDASTQILIDKYNQYARLLTQAAWDSFSLYYNNASKETQDAFNLWCGITAKNNSLTNKRSRYKKEFQCNQ